LVGGGRIGAVDLAEARAHGPEVVAVDGGAGAVLAAGLAPLVVVGDMDSLPSAAARAFADRLHRIDEQETTDFDKALRSVEAPLCLAVGFSGGRFDHELAVLNTLLRHAGRRCVVMGAESVTFLCPPVLEIGAEMGGVFSLYPLVPVGVVSQGLEWPTAGIDFRPDGMIGTSNRVTGPVRLEADRPGMMVILPRAELARAVSGLLAGPRWD
jgi:thiamine pyrophosphokinase